MLQERLKSAFLGETDALPLDIFRVCVGFLSIAYFLRLLSEAADFTLPNGLIDHDLSFELLFFTRLTLFGSWMSPSVMYTALGLGLVAAVGIIVGWRPKWCAFYILVIGVSHARWNFLVLSVDDTSIHLLMFWLLLMPIGRTLVLADYLRDKSSWKKWAQIQVRGATMRCFLANISIYYFTVGLSKLLSPLWREGLAVYAVLRMPIARTYGMWGEEHLSYLWALNHMTLLVECGLAFLPILRPWNRWKWPLLAVALTTHASIVILIGVPYVNATMALAMILVFRHEIMDVLRKKLRVSTPTLPVKTRTVDFPTKIALTFLLLISMVGTKGVPVLGNLYKPAVGVLYICGLAQDYHLFDWIDHFNFKIENKVVVRRNGIEEQVSDEELFPPVLRGKILQSYIHHMRWMPFSPAYGGHLRRSILERAAQRFARRNPGSGRVEVTVLVQRIDHANVSLDQPQERPLLIFDFADGQAKLVEPY